MKEGGSKDEGGEEARKRKLVRANPAESSAIDDRPRSRDRSAGRAANKLYVRRAVVTCLPAIVTVALLSGGRGNGETGYQRLFATSQIFERNDRCLSPLPLSRRQCASSTSQGSAATALSRDYRSPGPRRIPHVERSAEIVSRRDSRQPLGTRSRRDTAPR